VKRAEPLPRYMLKRALFLQLSLLVVLPQVASAMATLSKTPSTAGQASQALKRVRRVLPSPPQHWVGDGFHVFPVFHNLAFTEELSPWLMFDYASPKQFPASQNGKRRGVGQHPHRGFETITLAFQGAVEHGDSVGNRGVIGPGDVQWMSAARGIIHEEFHSTEFAKKGGTFEMAQLWLNLPAKDKMGPPRYQPILDKEIPVVPLKRVSTEGGECDAAAGDDGSVRVIAGDFGGAKGAAATFSPVELWDVTLKVPGVDFEFDFPESHNVVVFVRRGGLSVQGKKVGAQGVALMHREGTTLRVSASEPNTQLLILGGEPLNEPIAARGPFVMNTNAELQQAMADYHSGKLGQ